MDIQTNKFYPFHRPAPSLVALYCFSSDSQHNPRPRIVAGHSILTSLRLFRPPAMRLHRLREGSVGRRAHRPDKRSPSLPCARKALKGLVTDAIADHSDDVALMFGRRQACESGQHFLLLVFWLGWKRRSLALAVARTGSFLRRYSDLAMLPVIAAITKDANLEFSRSAPKEPVDCD